MEQYYYLIINLASISLPFAYSFDKRIRFSSGWKGLALGIMAMMLVFISWDVAFTAMGVWGFNDRYLIGASLFGLPLEEWLFFIAIPYACLFTYEALRYFIKRDILGDVVKYVVFALVPFLLLIGFLNLDKWYTGVTFISTAVFLGGLFWWRKPQWLGRFFVGYIVCLIPFYIVNGLLTGSWIPEQVVWYNDAENLGIRIGTIPVEDSVYMLLMLLMVTVVYERFKDRGDQASVNL